MAGPGFGKNGFNAGVMLMSLDRLRQTKFMENVASYWAFENGANDQITLNMQCNGTHSVLDPIWNVYQERPKDPVYKRPDDWRIVHMQSSEKPWIKAKKSRKHSQIWNGIHLSLIDALLGPQTEEDRVTASV
jgi:lipopolysaccharide biosynthesis glycosyltransferase